MKRSKEYKTNTQACKLPKKTMIEGRKIEKTVMDALILEAECVVCLDIPRGTINGCKNGHILCHNCETKLRNQNNGHIFNCPECRIPYTPCRNNFLRQFLAVYYADTPLKCKNLNCEFMDLLDRLSLHESYCHKRNLPCPLSVSKRCSWNGPATELHKHILRKGCGFSGSHPPMYMVRNRDEIVFQGSLSNLEGQSLFEERGNTIMRPIILLNPYIYRMWPFLQIE